MAEQLERSLTALEYIVLGLIGETPLSGYDIIGILESGFHRWSGSPGSIYPILKRLEKQSCISGELIVETRPHKIYHLSERGKELLVDWIRGPHQANDVLEGRDIALLKFLFAEKYLSRQEILDWLEAYEKVIESFDIQQHTFYETFLHNSSLHRQIVHEMTIMEVNTLRTWVQMARRRL